MPWTRRLMRSASILSVVFSSCSKGLPKGDEILINSIPQALAQTSKVCSSVNIGSTKTGINMTAVRDMGRIIKETAEASDMGLPSWWSLPMRLRTILSWRGLPRCRRGGCGHQCRRVWAWCGQACP